MCCPLCLQELEFWRRTGRQDPMQCAVGRLSRALLAGTPAPARASQFNVTESGSKAQRVIALDGTQSMATRARAVGIEISCQLLPDQLLLQAMQYCFGFVQSQAYVLDAPTRAVKGVDRDAEWQRVGGFDQHLDCEFHRAPPRTSRWPVCSVHD